MQTDERECGGGEIETESRRHAERGLSKTVPTIWTDGIPILNRQAVKALPA